MTKPIVMGFDPAKTTGWSYWDTADNKAAIRCGSIVMPDKADPYYTGEQIGLKLQAILESLPEVPHFAVIEQPFHATGGNGINAVIYGWGAVFAISSLLALWGIPIGTLAPATWRKQWYPDGFEPPQKPVMEKVDGNKVQKLNKYGKPMFTSDWKTPAIERCEGLGITLPSTKALADDAAEACALAMCWENKEMKFHAGRHKQPWMDLRQGIIPRSLEQERSAA